MLRRNKRIRRIENYLSKQSTELPAENVDLIPAKSGIVSVLKIMGKLITFILLVAIISCNQDNSNVKAFSDNSADSSISDNTYIPGTWTMCATGGNGTMTTANVCPRIILIGNGTGYVEMNSEIREHFI